MSERPNYVYVASSWRSPMQPMVVEVLRAAGIDCYDFRHPAEGEDGFHWSETMNWDPDNQLAHKDDYLRAIDHPIAVAGFARDFDAMRRADACVLVLPCGRSAHLELGWFVGTSRRTAILLDGESVTPELMYRMVDHIAPDMLSLLGWLGVED